MYGSIAWLCTVCTALTSRSKCSSMPQRFPSGAHGSPPGTRSMHREQTCRRISSMYSSSSAEVNMAGLLSKCTQEELVSNRGRKFHRAKKKPARRDELFVQAFVSLELSAALREPHLHNYTTIWRRSQ